MKIDAMTGLAVGGFALALLYTINRNKAAATVLTGINAPKGTFDAQAKAQADAAAFYRESTANTFFDGTGVYRQEQEFFNGTGPWGL